MPRFLGHYLDRLVAECDRVLVAATSSPCAAHLLQYVLQIRSAYANRVRVAMSAGAAQLCSPDQIDRVADEPTIVHSPELPVRETGVSLGEWADVVIVIPATVECLVRAAQGLSDDLVSAIVAGTKRPVLFAPALPSSVWRDPDVQRDVKALRAAGHYVATPHRAPWTSRDEPCDELGPDAATLMTHLWHFANVVRERPEGRVTLTIS